MSGTRAFKRHSALFILSSLVVLASLWAAVGGQTATAQAGKQVELAGVDAKAFPQISFYLRASDVNGAFLEGLDSSNTEVSENGQTLPVETLEVMQPGVQTLIVLNLSDALAKKVENQTLFERVRAAWNLAASAARGERERIQRGE